MQDFVHEHVFRPWATLASRAMSTKLSSMSHRLLSAVDLAIDLATLGEYGLEPQTADGPCRERSGHTPDWEALRRPSAARVRGDHPSDLPRPVLRASR